MTTSSSESTLVLIGVLVPTFIVAFAAVAIVAYFRVRKRHVQTRATTRGSSVQRKKVKAQFDLDQVSTVSLYAAVSVHYSRECAVCLDTFEAHIEVRQLACGHLYHSACLQSVAECQQQCCVCKQEFERKFDVSIMTTQGDARDL